MHSRSKHGELFRESLSKADIDDEVKKANQQRLAVLEFLQHMQLLMQRQPQLMPSLLRVLANLAAVSEGRLGDRCLEALQDVMKSGTEEKDLVIEVMNECVIPQLKVRQSTYLSFSIHVLPSMFHSFQSIASIYSVYSVYLRRESLKF